MVTHLEPNILECEVEWALGSITTNKASGGDGIPVELFHRADDGDLLRPFAGQVVDDLLGNVAGFGGKIAVRKEAFHVVDRHRLIDGAAGTGVFAALVADSAADRGERVFALDERERLVVASLFRHFKVALNRHVRGARGFAGRGAGLVRVDARGIAVILIPSTSSHA